MMTPGIRYRIITQIAFSPYSCSHLIHITGSIEFKSTCEHTVNYLSVSFHNKALQEYAEQMNHVEIFLTPYKEY